MSARRRSERHRSGPSIVTASTPASGDLWLRCVTILGEPENRCSGVQVSHFDRCLAHLKWTELNGFLKQLPRGAHLDVRGTTLDSILFNRITQAFTSPNSSSAEFGRVDFTGATFTENSNFSNATFTENAYFPGATFTRYAYFDLAVFTKNAYFRGATFTEGASFGAATFTAGSAYFGEATFTKDSSFSDGTFAERAYFDLAKFNENAYFDRATFTKGVDFTGATFTKNANFWGATFIENADFTGATFTKNADFTGAAFTENAGFRGATFTKNAGFQGATFTKGASFDGATFIENADFTDATFIANADFTGATFTKNADFTGAKFPEGGRLGPLTADRLDLGSAQFGVAVVIEADAGEVSCLRARFSGGVELRVRNGIVDLAEVLFGAASSLATSATEFAVFEAAGLEDNVARTKGRHAAEWHTKNYSLDHRPVLTSLRGTDVSELALTDVDLRWCRFAGAHHLDKLRIEGDSHFPRLSAARWRSSRQILFEEHGWAARRKPTSGWLPSAPFDKPGDRVEQVGPDRLAALYRSLRKALEDGKNEAGAGDFYFGEQEARRSAASTSRTEGAVLWAYWLLSGYGQRASRAIAGFVGVVAVATVLLVAFGLPTAGPTSQSTTVTHSALGGGQQTVTTTIDVAAQLPPGSARWTWDRIDTSARIALGAVAFRDASQKLTTAGIWTVMVARFVGPILLALAALAVRARVKR
jgi:hypothetical protein